MIVVGGDCAGAAAYSPGRPCATRAKGELLRRVRAGDCAGEAGQGQQGQPGGLALGSSVAWKKKIRTGYP